MIQTPDLAALESAAELVYQHLQPTPQIQWPLLSQRCGAQVWVKHENHNLTGAFKVRGGLVYLDGLIAREPSVAGIVTATRGNHGQSVALAAAQYGVKALIVVPEGNNPEKNAAMAALGAEVITYGSDFNAAIPHAQKLAREYNYHMMPSFHTDLVRGVGTYAMELLRAVPDLTRVYVPIGLGSGICGMISARNALNLNTEIIGVVSSAADCYYQSLQAGECRETATANTLADGMAVRVPSSEALSMMLGNLADVVRVDDDEILAAMSYYFTDTHNIAEGAGAAPLAALLKSKGSKPTDKVGLVLSGGNVDRQLYRTVLDQ